MKLFRSVKAVLALPLWALQIFTSAKSFLDNPIIGSRRLNALGLHRKRVQIAGRMAAWRRSRLEHRVPSEWREAFDRDGFVVVSNAIPPQDFAKLRSALLEYEGAAREMRQGDAITRRLAIDPEMLSSIPALRQLLHRDEIRALFRYVSSFAVEPLHYLQTIVTHAGPDEIDPQEALHADAFHTSLKAWLFLNPVAKDAAPFTYVPGSHRLTPERLDWEQRRSIVASEGTDRLSARGSPRVCEDDLASMKLPPARGMAVDANTLIVADTLGFHARGASVGPVERVEIWSYSRRNPFLPWLGLDPLSLPGISERRVNWLWGIRDRFEWAFGQPWRKVGKRRAL